MINKGLNILYTTVHFPYPPIGGDRIKQIQILEHLSKSHKIFLLSLDRGYEIKEEYIDEVRKMGIECYVFKIYNLKAYITAAIMSPLGLPLEVNFFRNKELKRAVAQIFRTNEIDLVINYYLRSTAYTSKLNAKKLLIADDCRSFYQSRTAEESSNFRQKSIRSFEAYKLKKYESEIISDFDITTVVTNEDKAQMEALKSRTSVRVLSNGVNTEQFKPPADGSLRKDIVITGKLNVWVNYLIIKRIVGEIFPKIRRELPDTKLHIVGSEPIPEILSLCTDSILIHKNVPDVAPYLQNAAVFLHPHLGGSGIQNKLLEAMACGCPVVTSVSGSWGLRIENGFNGFVANNDEEFAQIAIMLLKDEELVRQVGNNQREYIINNHTWGKVYNAMDNILIEIMSK